MKHIFACGSRLSLVLWILALAVPATAQAPVIRKVEPPNWWTNYTPELTLLLSGENLKGVKAESKSAEATVLGSQASENGHYLFVRLRLKTQLRTQLKTRLKTGLRTSVPKNEKVAIRLVGAGGSTTLERSEEHTSELQSLRHLVCRLLL